MRKYHFGSLDLVHDASNIMSELLTPPQLEALLDILIHHETYAEVQSFQDAEAIENYGWPFISCDDGGRPVEPHRPSSSPLLQLVLTRLLLQAPAIKDLSAEFWPAKFKGIMKKFGDADLSDSYDKGTLGTRKRLATAASVIHEALTRGLLLGVSCLTLPDLQRPVDRRKAEDLTGAWQDCIRQLVYGNLIDEIFDQLTQTAELESHSPAVEGAVEYAELHIAAFLHQAFIVSPEGPYLLRLIENIHKLVPYTIISQTLRVGNAATMISAISRLFLSKVSFGTISNWIGLTSSPADGMNLMQRIILLVLEWDIAYFRKVAEKIGLDQENISDEQMAAIDRHLAAGQKQHELTRQKSIRERTSIIVAIFNTENKELAETLTDSKHSLCLEYYAAKLAIRDREQIIDVLCNSTPDLTTAIVLEGLGVFDPMIRVVHKNVDLRKHLAATESFLTDFIKTTKPKKPKAQKGDSRPSAPSVKDFVQLVKRNRHLLWKYLHDFCSGCPDLRDTWRGWMKDTIKDFRQKPQSDTLERDAPIPEESQTAKVSDIETWLQDIFSKLPDARKRTTFEQIDAHSQYLASLGELSVTTMQMVIDDIHGSNHTDTSMPAVYTSRWQSLLEDTLITPSQPEGPLRYGKDVRDLRATRKPDQSGNSNALKTNAIVLTQQPKSSNLKPPDVSLVVGELGPHFKRMVADISRDGLPRVAGSYLANPNKLSIISPTRNLVTSVAFVAVGEGDYVIL
ncbi:hypothetical protein F4861DRAFT_489004 [Xylaria intraflava]|nr:hypothetical protein F4861DRAFT_489004 [Xylaria intraflava]